MASFDEVLAALGEIASRELGIPPPRPEDSLSGDLALDSIQLITLVVELENRFRVKLGPEDGEGLRTVRELAVLVAARSGEQGR